jgi:metacaspase-1
MSILKFFKNLFSKKNSETCCKSSANSVGKFSLHIGINNYPGTANDLRGCVNDANNWEKLLREQYGFKTSKLLDKYAINRRVVKKIKEIVNLAETGSHIVITFSGHGTNVRDLNGDEEDRRDEALCLFDKLLIDDDLRALLSEVKEGIKLTFISDSCHSGTVTRSFLNSIYEEDAPKPRYLPPQDDNEAFELASKNISKKIFQANEEMDEVLLTGCKSSEYSYDAKIDGSFQGAMSAHAIKIIESDPNITYAELYQRLRKDLPCRRYPQTPQLEGREENLNSSVFS